MKFTLSRGGGYYPYFLPLTIFYEKFNCLKKLSILILIFRGEIIFIPKLKSAKLIDYHNSIHLNNCDILITPRNKPFFLFGRPQ